MKEKRTKKGKRFVYFGQIRIDLLMQLLKTQLLQKNKRLVLKLTEI